MGKSWWTELADTVWKGHSSFYSPQSKQGVGSKFLVTMCWDVEKRKPFKQGQCLANLIQAKMKVYKRNRKRKQLLRMPTPCWTLPQDNRKLLPLNTANMQSLLFPICCYSFIPYLSWDKFHLLTHSSNQASPLQPSSITTWLNYNKIKSLWSCSPQIHPTIKPLR